LDPVVDHGGSLSRAARLFPHAPRPWLDLSTGINPHTYPFEALPASAFARLPEESRLRELQEIAADAYGAPSAAHVVAAPGTQILLPMVAALAGGGRAAVLSPTYAEHARACAIAGFETVETDRFDELATADLAIVVNPNNPDGRIVPHDDLANLAARLRARGGLLVVDEAFMDVCHAEQSLCGSVGDGGIIVLRSFGKFFGLAGVRLGFAIAAEPTAELLRARFGPWAVSGPALEIGITALADLDWHDAMRARLAEAAAGLNAMLAGADLDIIGGTSLYRLVRAPDAESLFDALGRAGILVRNFERHPDLLRFGIPGGKADFGRLRGALESWRGDRERRT
jgi:cobalamin biosynthetic protein CobC